MKPRERAAMNQHPKSTEAAPVVIALGRDKEEERLIQGDLVGVAHLLGQALSTASAAHSIACRRKRSHPPVGGQISSLQGEALDRLVESTGRAEHATKRALEDTNAARPLLSRRYKPLARIAAP